MNDVLETFVNKLTTQGVDVRQKKYYTKLSNNAVIFKNKKSLKVFVADNFDVPGVTFITGKTNIGRFRKYVKVTQDTAPAVLGELEQVLTTTIQK